MSERFPDGASGLAIPAGTSGTPHSLLMWSRSWGQRCCGVLSMRPERCTSRSEVLGGLLPPRLARFAVLAGHLASGEVADLLGRMAVSGILLGKVFPEIAGP